MTTIATLYAEELQAAMRGRFAWIGAGVLLLSIGVLATVGTQDTWLDGYGIVAYGFAPLAFIPLAAGFIASARASRFVESVFTAPVERRNWLVAKILVLLTMAAAYYAALTPMMLVYVAHIGMPLLLQKFLLWCPLLLVMSVTIGVLIGVLFIGRSIAAPTGAAMGVVMAYAGLLALQELLVSQGNGATRSGHLTLLSPPALLKNALGFAVAVGSIPATTTGTWISIGVLTLGSIALATWVFLRTQGVETWEATQPQRWTITLAIVAITLFPAFAADANYDKAAPRVNNAPAIRGLFSRAGTSLALVDPGAPAPARCCSTILNRDEWPMSTDTPTQHDLLLLLPVETSQPVGDLRIQVQGENGLEASADPAGAAAAGAHLEERTYPDDTGPAAPDGHHIAAGWVARVSVTLNPTKPWDIGGDRYPLTVTAHYRAGGASEVRTFSARAAVDAQVGPAIYEMGAASLLLPLVCFGAAVTRWRRTR